MHPPRSWGRPSRLSRRALLGGSAALVVPAALASGCTPAKKAIPPKPGPEVGLLTTAMDGERHLVALYASVISAHPRLAPTLKPLYDHHNEHLAVLQRYYVRGTETQTPTHPFSPTPNPSPTTAPPGDEAGSLAALRTAERQAGSARVDDAQNAAPGLAQLMASISACEALHVVILAGVT